MATVRAGSLRGEHHGKRIRLTHEGEEHRGVLFEERFEQDEQHHLINYVDDGGTRQSVVALEETLVDIED